MWRKPPAKKILKKKPPAKKMWRKPPVKKATCQEDIKESHPTWKGLRSARESSASYAVCMIVREMFAILHPVHAVATLNIRCSTSSHAQSMQVQNEWR